MTHYGISPDEPFAQYMAKKEVEDALRQAQLAAQHQRDKKAWDQWCTQKGGRIPVPSMPPVSPPAFYRVEIEETAWETLFLTRYVEGDWRITEFYQSRGFARRAWAQFWFPEQARVVVR